LKKITSELKIIGIIHSPYKTISEAPYQGGEEISEIEIYQEYKEGLKDIQRFTHLDILYWLHKSKGFSLLTKTPWDENLHGVFATRAPHRPNPIGHSIVKLIKKEGNVLKVRGLDAIEGTPVIDIKPCLKNAEEQNHTKRWRKL
jgi:formylmethanofuran dehydrogenase subunit E